MLLDRDELYKSFPALKGRGRNPHNRVNWLLRARAIPAVKIGRRLYFDSEEIQEWIETNKIPAQNAKK